MSERNPAEEPSRITRQGPVGEESLPAFWQRWRSIAGFAKARILTYLAVGMGGGWLLFQSLTPARPAWEYNFIALEKPTDMRCLYDLGQEGWELVSVYQDWHGQQAVLLKPQLNRPTLKLLP